MVTLWGDQDQGESHYSLQSQVKKARYCYGSRRDSIKICMFKFGIVGYISSYIIGKHPYVLCEGRNSETVEHVLLKCNKYNIEKSYKTD